MPYQQVIKAAEDFLANEPGVSKSGRTVVEHLQILMNSGEIAAHPPAVIFSYLSRAANHDDTSRIVSGGPYGGYSIESLPAPQDTLTELNPAVEANGSSPIFRVREKHLYPLMSQWLEASDYVAADVSALKAGGQWGNPDLAGVLRAEMLGAIELEVVSVEVKTSEEGWERFIFEAVSHKRFVNRSWYCYRTSKQYPPLPKHMAYYAERYKVGIIQIYLLDHEIQEMVDRPQAAVQYLDRVQERVRALYEPVPMQEKRSFLSRAGMELNLQVARAP